MANYTMELRTVCEALVGLPTKETYPEIDSLIEQARPLLFSFDYPIFNTNYKIALETKIMKQYFFREICDVPVAKWKLFLENRLNRIMPYYNRLYESELLEFDPLSNMKYERKFNRKNVGNTDSNATRNLDGTLTGQGTVNNTTQNIHKEDGTGKDVTDANNSTTANEKLRLSDTPQGNLEGTIGTNYLTQAQVNDRTSSDTGKTTRDTTDTRNVTDNGTSTSTNNATTTTRDTETNNNRTNMNTTEDFLENYLGFQGQSGSELLQKYRETFLNIDSMILDELNELFFGIY